jgi:uncharacterized protein (DUF2249 family)
MSDLTIASSEADARAAEAVEAHHAELSGALSLRAAAVASAARSGGSVTAARDDLVTWARHELVPHALAEEGTMYAEAGRRHEARLLVEAMLAEHQVIVGLVDELAGAEDPVSAALAARALESVFAVHLAKENDQVLPLLVAAPDVSVVDLLGGMHELLGGHADEHEHEQGHGHGHAHEPATAAPGHHCACGEHDDEVPELDARTIPHAIRHATIFGALDAVGPGRSMVLVAPHDPLPLLAQVESRYAGAFGFEYLERGPESWRLLLSREVAEPARA